MLTLTALIQTIRMSIQFFFSRIQGTKECFENISYSLDGGYNLRTQAYCFTPFLRITSLEAHICSLTHSFLMSLVTVWFSSQSHSSWVNSHFSRWGEAIWSFSLISLYRSISIDYAESESVACKLNSTPVKRINHSLPSRPNQGSLIWFLFRSVNQSSQASEWAINFSRAHFKCVGELSDETSCMQLINSLSHAISGWLLFICKATHDVSEKHGHIYHSVERAAAITYQNANVLGLSGWVVLSKQLGQEQRRGELPFNCVGFTAGLWRCQLITLPHPPNKAAGHATEGMQT